ncbi:nitroreductase family protein [Cellulosilyticum sp. I15G10I2]|uniref:nitroreductase family protein n=1 Tax=Cellulosilyticum sp. I15G10I2 TaxID=1892843 RepID=UPI00085BEF75|nr:nitroreductase family protein [Cellulosilyticum sp. I15G10I2]
MNETLKTIKNRRAIRNYHPDQISDSALQEILNAALYAPNAMNRQSWHFTVIQNKSMLDQLADSIIENVINFNNKALVNMVSSPGYHPFYKAPTIILISGDMANEFIQIEAGTAAQNISLAAESLNIGSCIMTMSNFIFASSKADVIKKSLGIPNGYNPICGVVLGYKAGQVPPVPSRNKEVITYYK